MNNSELDKYLNIVNEEKIKRGLENFIPLYPMFRVINNKLYVGVMLTNESDNVWDKNENIKAEYWVLIDCNSNEIVEFNDTSKNDFIFGDLIKKNSENKEKELSMYTVKKTIEYKNYLFEDIKNDQLPLQKKLSSILDKEIEIDGKNIDINDYLISNLENDIKEKVDELINLLVISKYGSITFYYNLLFRKVINEFKNDNTIDYESIKLCIEIMDNYYDGVIGISNFFNL